MILDNRNTAAIFNAAAMAAGGGSGVNFLGVNGIATNGTSNGIVDPTATSSAAAERSLDPGLRALRINTDVETNHDDEVSSAVSSATSASASDAGDGSGISAEREVWNGELSAVVGLQKRGLRGLMEGRRAREREMVRGSSRNRDEGGPSNGDGVGLGLMAGGA